MKRTGMKAPVRGGQRTGKTGLMHRLFDVVVILKGLDGGLEIIGGTALLLVRAGAIMVLVDALTARELSEDPGDLIANLLRQWAAGFGHSAQMFAAAYLPFHGFAKVTLATFLLMGKTWAYPVALTFFSIFVVYAGFRLSLGWTWVLAALIGLDLVTIWLVAREWRAIASAKAGSRRGQPAR